MKLRSGVSEDPSKVEQLRQSVVHAFEAHANPELATKVRYNVEKGKDYKCYGIIAPEFKEIMRGFRKPFRELSSSERLSLAERLLQSGISEQADAAVYLLSLSTSDLLPSNAEFLDRIPDYFHGWGATDGFGLYVIQPLLRGNKEIMLRILSRWSLSRNRWKRRACMVAFARKIGESGLFTDDFLRLCKTLVWDGDDLVQKGVGWALKDTMRGAKSRIMEYVKELRRNGVPSTIILYAIRDLKGRDRQAILEIRPGGIKKSISRS